MGSSKMFMYNFLVMRTYLVIDGELESMRI